MSKKILTRSKIKQQSIGRYLKEFKSDQLKLGNKNRRRIHNYKAVKKTIITYLDLRAKPYKRDKCGVTWNLT